MEQVPNSGFASAISGNGAVDTEKKFVIEEAPKLAPHEIDAFHDNDDEVICFDLRHNNFSGEATISTTTNNFSGEATISISTEESKKKNINLLSKLKNFFKRNK